ncbi:Similar to CDKL2: Cyclin-dependent kinase-like 2 (Homo sapiens) [Cotesia congregata]|uniref:cyclin-dependent kinase n=1 Tax=Cotesia congregata TaxID=51543 RepID=A0A8J2ML43_COTCN|nr:Similar to CDKL2: Cyclin-dependent kinase-like 2 (Homo sapiens) [Cotesia congregata]
MDKYENIEVVGEGSYGIVIKCRHRETGEIVAIKKFLETEEDVHVRKMAFREIRMLKKLRHDNLVNMIEVFRRRKRFYLVFEYLDHTVLDELEVSSNGLGPQVSRRYIFQVLRGLNFCHSNHVSFLLPAGDEWHGGLCSKHQWIVNKNGVASKHRKMADESELKSLKNLFPSWSSVSLDFLSQTLKMDPETRLSCAQLLQHALFTQDNFTEKFLSELQVIIARENSKNLLQKRFERRLTSEETPRSYESAGRWRTHLIKEMGCKDEDTEKKQKQSLFIGSISLGKFYLKKPDVPKKNSSLPALPYLHTKNFKKEKESRNKNFRS